MCIHLFSDCSSHNCTCLRRRPVYFPRRLENISHRYCPCARLSVKNVKILVGRTRLSVLYIMRDRTGENQDDLVKLGKPTDPKFHNNFSTFLNISNNYYYYYHIGITMVNAINLVQTCLVPVLVYKVMK